MVDKVPEEVISHILSFLSLSDRKEASLVSHLWYRASLHPKLLEQTVVTFRVTMSTLDVVKTLARRRTPNLVLDQIDSSFTSKEVIEESTKPLIQVLHSLTLKGSNITESVFMALIQNCNSLMSLDLSCCNSLFFSGQLLSKADDIKRLQMTLKHVTNLSLASIHHLSDVMLNRFFSVCCSLESLNLSGNQIVFRTDMFLGKASASMSMLTYANIEKYLKEKSGRIKSLNLSRTAMNDDSLKSLSSINGLELNEIILVCCRDIGDDGIVALTEKQQSLQNLDLSQSSETTDRAMQAICHNLANLKVLKLAKCRQVTDASVSRLHHLPLLEFLDLSSCYTLTSRGLTAGLCSKPLTSLTHLNLHGCTAVRDSFVIKLAKSLPQLVHLDLSSCDITDVSVYFICKYLHRLQVLHLAWCKNISDDGLLGRPLGIKNDHCLRKEHDGECKCTRQDFGKNVLNLPKIIKDKEAQKANWEDMKKLLEEDDEGQYQIIDLRGLKILDLTACSKISDESVMAMNFPELKKLHLGMCLSISDDSLKAIALNLHSLEILDVTQCNKITDEGLKCVAQMKRLSSLNVSNCDRVSDDGLNTLMSHCDRLHHLDVSMCDGITYKMVEKMESAMPHLQTIQKRLINGMVI